MRLRHFSSALLCVVAASSVLCARATLDIPSDGSDGDLVVTNNVVIDLREAATGPWDSPSPREGKGVYDSDKWAVVFKYRSVSVDSNATVTFKNNATRAPVVWLVRGEVTIRGQVDLSGQGMQRQPALAQPGPGGFRGGKGASSSMFWSGSGLGPGGSGSHAAYATGFGPSQALTYGNASLLPLLGGSGGGGGQWEGGPKDGGGAGGGALLIACSGAISLPSPNSAISATGGYSSYGGGSGGGIRLVASALSGVGLITVAGGSGGGSGRIRVESITRSDQIRTVPTAEVANLVDGARPALWPEDLDGPSVRILSVGGRAAPADPIADLGVLGADVTLARTNLAEVLVETIGVETNSTVRIRRTPLANADFALTNAVVAQVVSVSPLKLIWKANMQVSDGMSAFQVHVIRP